MDLQIPNGTYYICYQCYRKMCRLQHIEIIEHEDHRSCYCDEIQAKIKHETECRVCHDPTMGGCPMFLYFVTVTNFNLPTQPIISESQTEEPEFVTLSSKTIQNE